MVNILHQGTVSQGLEAQLINWMREKSDKYNFELFWASDRIIANNRNKIVKRFLAGDWDILFMIDDDNPPVRNPFDLLDHDKDVIGAVCPGRDDRGIHFHVYKLGNKFPHFKQYEPEERSGLHQVDAIGTGCIAIKRRVLEKIKKPFEDLFDQDGILVSNDDMHFCWKCHKKKIKIWTDWNYTCSHYKTVDLLQMAALIYEAAKTGKPYISKS